MKKYLVFTSIVMLVSIILAMYVVPRTSNVHCDHLSSSLRNASDDDVIRLIRKSKAHLNYHGLFFRWGVDPSEAELIDDYREYFK